MNRIAIIQARLGSSRLPHKVFQVASGKSILAHVLDRVRFGSNIDGIVVATTLSREDKKIIEFVREYNHSVKDFCGSENDVLDRYFRAAERFKANWIVRVTSDSPLIDPFVLDFVVKTAVEGNYDYVSNSLVPTFPDGLDVECFTFKALEKAWEEAKLPAEREHVTPYVRMNCEKFRLANVFYRKNFSHLCWAVDSPDDLKLFLEVAKRLDLNRIENLHFEQILDLFSRESDLFGINQVSVRDEKLIRELPNIFSMTKTGIDQYEYLSE